MAVIGINSHGKEEFFWEIGNFTKKVLSKVWLVWQDIQGREPPQPHTSCVTCATSASALGELTTKASSLRHAGTPPKMSFCALWDRRRSHQISNLSEYQTNNLDCKTLPLGLASCLFSSEDSVQNLPLHSEHNNLSPLGSVPVPAPMLPRTRSAAFTTSATPARHALSSSVATSSRSRNPTVSREVPTLTLRLSAQSTPASPLHAGPQTTSFWP